MVIIPSKMGRHNKRAVLDRLLRLGTASRAELAKSLGLSQPTAGKIADELLELGVFEETDEETERDTDKLFLVNRKRYPSGNLVGNNSE